MDANLKASVEKVKTVASDILEQCQKNGLTIQEVRLLPGELSRQAEKSIEKHISSEVFLKRI